MSPANDVTARLTDASKYTGSHKERFDADGKGKGLAGRKNLVCNDGSTSSASRDHIVDKTPVKQATKPTVKAKTDAETYGEKPRKIIVFQYGDKNHAGESLMLTKQKFPSMKQVNEQMIKMIPTGKAKVVVDRNMKEVKGLEDFVDGGIYLAITAFDRSKLDPTKVPVKFSK
ncbi:hypothetical protein HDU67_005406 [Dinochytrium kinnereticum]|nr:hypothetical protein HDU67_005406 [Dinochytrium kinnereticum]